ncbi:MAG: hypothetical protein HY694_10465 [Deltaproteobacteria bacterium]|nr:hypothetical protein [Deltaproteobacteria bacterium]
MKRSIVILTLTALVGFQDFAFGAEKAKYPPPRFPSYVKPPKSIEDVMPYARAAVRQVGGRTPLGLVEKGTAALIVTEAAADGMVMQALKRAYEERGVKVYIVPEYELVGVNKEDAVKAIKATHWYTSEQGYMEAARWIQDRFVDPEVPKKWLKERRPDLYKAMFEKGDEVPQNLREIAKQLGGRSVADGIIKFLDQHPDIKAVFWRRGGRPRTARLLGSHSAKFYGNFIFDNRWELMNKAATFPGDVWKLAEERVIEPLAWVDQVQASDPEGTNISFEVAEQEAKIWGSAAYLQGHLFLSPYQATGRFPYSSVEYPALQKKWNPPLLIKVNGVFAGTNNHTGSFPRIEVHVKDGYVTEVKGGGLYGEAWREFLKYPKINELTYPYQDKPGYWWFYEAGTGTNPKFFKRPDENMVGNNQSERNNAGVIHWGFGGSVVHDPDAPTESKAWIDFPKQHGLPKDHWWHIHNLLVTYRVRVRGTKSTWITLIDKGELTALRSPEIRALSSRYGDPKDILSEDWVAHLPGINAAGRYEDYAKDPWRTITEVIRKVDAGTYEYFYPPVKKK